MNSTPPRFSVLLGGGAPSGLSPRVDLTLVDEQAEISAQRTLAAWGGSRCAARLLSVGINGLTFDAFQTLLTDAGVRFIVDLRHLAAFRGHGFSEEKTHSVLHRLGVTYERCYELRNEFAGSSSNRHTVLERYATCLRDTKSAVLDKIVAYLQRGPVLLLGPEPTHAGTEREIVAALLGERLSARLEVLALTQHSSTLRMGWSSWIIDPQATLPKPETRSKKSRSRARPKNQLTLADEVLPKR
jgi:Protein of unknown function, DUF488